MKKTLLLLAVAALFASCDLLGTSSGEKEQGDGSDIHISDGLPVYNLASDRDTAFVRFFTSKDDDDIAWTAECEKSWVKIEPDSGFGKGEIYISVAPNENAESRDADVIIKAGAAKKAIKISQCLSAGALPAESWYLKNYWERTDREKLVLRGKVKSYNISQYVSFHKYYFDEAGHLVKNEYHHIDNSGDEEISDVWNHTYDAAGHRTQSQLRFSDGGTRTFTYEYNNTGKFVPTDAYIWIEFSEDGYESGKNFPLSIWKDLSSILYVDDTPFYYERYEMNFAFGDDGNLTLSEKYFRERDGEPEESSVYHITYENGYPVSCAENGVVVTYGSNGVPLTYYNGKGKTYTFVKNCPFVLIDRMDDPNCQEYLPVFWSQYSYNSNWDVTTINNSFNREGLPDTYDKYFYDSHGNWILRNQTLEPRMFGPRTASPVSRAIEYYQ